MAIGFHFQEDMKKYSIKRMKIQMGIFANHISNKELGFTIYKELLNSILNSSWNIHIKIFCMAMSYHSWVIW